MENAKVCDSESELKVVLPLTQPTGKIRIKERSFFSDYGTPVAARQTRLGLSHYAEWQIGYDLEDTETNRAHTTLTENTFVNYKGVRKLAYELSEVLLYSAKKNLVTIESIRETYDLIKQLSDLNTFEELESMSICRTNPTPVVVNGMDFYKMTVKYPMLVHRFGQYDIYAEVVVKEKQRAVGTQAMLYVCLPITALRFKVNAIGRVLDAKETADWVIGREEAALSLELFRIFGMLSPKHRHDVLAILEMLLKMI